VSVTLTAEVYCDVCKKVIACGEPHPHTEFSFASSAIYEAERKARAHGAVINAACTLCKDCAAKEKEFLSSTCKTT